MKDLLDELAAAHRAVERTTRDGGEIVRLTIRRTYPTDVADLWSAISDPERIARWFGPVTGRLAVGGAFEVTGQANGTVLACDAPSRLQISYGGPESIVTVSLADAAAGAELVLEHSVPIETARSVAGSLFVGPGWDDALVALRLHLDGTGSGDPAADAASPERMAYAQAAIDRWADAARAAGAGEDDIAGMIAMVQGAYAGEWSPEG